MKTSPEISIIVPVRDEAANLDALIQAVNSQLSDITKDYEIIFVDDGSRDETWSKLTGLSNANPRLCAISFNRSFGKESAMRAGLKFARGAAVIIMDGDLQHPPSLLPQMIHSWRADRVMVVEAVKDSKRGSAFSFSGIFNRILSGLTGFDFSGSSDFKLLDRKVVDQINALPERLTFFRGIVSWLGYSSKAIKFTPSPRTRGRTRFSWLGYSSKAIKFTPAPRTGGRTRWSLLRLVGLAIDAVTGFSNSPLRIVTVASAALMAFAVILSIQTLANWLRGVALEGFTTVIIIVLLVGSVLAFGLGMIGEYLARIFDEIKARPPYIIGEKIGLSESQSG